jgi:hypothetical protein
VPDDRSVVAVDSGRTESRCGRRFVAPLLPAMMHPLTLGQSTKVEDTPADRTAVSLAQPGTLISEHKTARFCGMAIGSPKLSAAQVSVGVAAPVPASSDQRFIDAARGEFPTLVARQDPPAGAPASLPHLALQSTTAQLAVSSVRSDLQKQFYGEFAADFDQALGYLSRKLHVILAAWRAAGAVPSFLGAVLQVQFPFTGEGPTPTGHLLSTFLRTEVDAAAVQDAQVRISFKLADRYFLSLQPSNYESKLLERPLLPGPATLEVKPWEGVVNEVGVVLTIDINDRLRSINARADVPVEDDDLDDMLRVAKRTADASDEFIRTGALSVEALLTQETK